MARFEPGFVEQSRVYLWFYEKARASRRMRDLVFRLPQSRPRMAIIGGFFQWLFHEWNADNYDATFQVIDPEAEIDFFGLGTYSGRDGVLEAWDEWRKPFSGVKFEVSSVVDNHTGDVAIVLRFHGREVKSEIDLRQPGAMVWTVRKGTGVRASFYSTKDAALKAAGLSE